MKYLWLALIAYVFTATTGNAANSGLDPTKLEVKVYGVYISKNEDCSSPVETLSNAAPDYQDLLSAPTLVDKDNGDGSLNGTYKCVIIKMSDQIRVTPKTSTDGGMCVAGTAFVTGVCGVHGSGPGSTQQKQDLEGTITDCTNNEDIVFIYISRGTATGSEGDYTFLTPTTTETDRGVNLGADLVISGSQSSEFVINASGQVGESEGACGMERPTFTFR